MSNTIKAICIDPINKTVYEVDAPSTASAIERRHFKRPDANAAAVTLADDVDAWVDDNAIDGDWTELGVSVLMGAVTTVGPVVLTGSDSAGRPCDLPADVTLELIQGSTTFPDPKKVRIPGPREWGIDGTGKRVVKLLGPEWLTHDKH